MKFSVVASFSGVPSHLPMHETCYRDILRASRESGLSVDETEPGDSEYAYLATECGEPEPGDTWYDWKREVQDLTVSGIIEREAFSEWIDTIGAFAEDCETMGTLGGPMAPWGGVVADISFRMESSCIIDSIRVTPIPTDASGEPLGTCDSAEEAERIWQRIRSAALAVYGG